MEYMLRRNVIMRDWRNGINKYYDQHGFMPDHVEMSHNTFNMFGKYMRKHGILIDGRQETEYAYDGHGNIVAQISSGYEIYCEGIKIIFDDNIETEKMRIVW